MNILFLAGGQWQLPLVIKLKALGHTIVLVDPNDNSVCSEFSDHNIYCDVRDVNYILKSIPNGLKISYVISDQTDVTVLPSAELRTKLGLPGLNLNIATRFTNKRLMRVSWNKFYPDYAIPFCSPATSKDVTEFISQVQGQVILKPARGQSSRGIAFLDKNSTTDEINSSLENASQVNGDEKVLEAVVKGIEVTVEGLMLRGQHYSLTTSSKEHFTQGIAKSLIYPAQLDKTLVSKLVNVHDTYMESLGLDFGLTHTEYMVNEKTGNIALIETAARGGGSLIPSHIIPQFLDKDLYDFYIEEMLNPGNSAMPRILKHEQKVVGLKFFELPKGRIKSIDGLEYLHKDNNLIHFHLDVKVGDNISPMIDDRSRHGFFIIIARDVVEFECLFEKYMTTLKVHYYENV